MASRERSRRGVGLTRMDAALDAMVLYGFRRELVRKTVNELLKVYGKEGWVFIEEGSYSLLIDTILQKQEASEQQKSALQPQDELGGADDAVPSAAGPSNGAFRLLPPQHQGGDDAVPTAAGPPDGETKSMDLEIVKTMDQIETANPPKPEVLKNVRAPASRPCHGWIGGDDGDSDDEFVELVPATPQQLKALINGTGMQREPVLRQDC